MADAMTKNSEKPTSKKPAVIRGKNGGKREGSGRKPFEPTTAERKQVEAFVGFGLPYEHICALIQDGIGIDTLRKYFATELLTGKAKAGAKIGQTIFQKAINGDTTALIWWSKCQMGWRENAAPPAPVAQAITFTIVGNADAD